MRLVGLAAALVAATVAVVAWVVLAGSGLAPGECFDPPDTRGDFAEVETVPCSEPHRAEVYFAGGYDEPGPYDELALLDFATDRCVTEFEPYTGRHLQTESELDIGWWFPSEDEWVAGRRQVVCYVVRQDDGSMTGSLRQP